MDFTLSNIFNEICAENDNGRCADCLSEYITDVNCYFKITLCDRCALVHRFLPEGMNYLKSIKQDRWHGLSDVTLLRSLNNWASNDHFQKFVPIHFSPLTYEIPFLWRRYFITAKYAHQKFTTNQNPDDLPKKFVKEGTLWKRGKFEEKNRLRYFVLQENGWLLYYQGLKRSDHPKQIIKIDKLDLFFVAEKMDIETGLQLTYSENNTIRDIYVFSDKSKEIIDWYNVIKASKLDRLKKLYPASEEKCLVRLIFGNMMKEGYLVKSGSKPTDTMRRRWFTLTEKPLFKYTQWILRYYEDKMESQPKGEIYIGKYSDNFSIDLKKTFTGKESDNRTFTLVTDSRSYDFIADTTEERASWLGYLHTALSRQSDCFL